MRDYEGNPTEFAWGRGCRGKQMTGPDVPNGVGGRPPGGTPRLRTRIAWPCPRCHAAPGRACVRLPGGKISGRDIGGGYTKPMKTLHPERTIGATR